MTTATTSREAGRLLAERLGLKVIGQEGHDLKCGCPLCSSSDAGRVHVDTGCFYCFACQKALNAFDLCKVVVGHDAAKRLMIDVSLFDDWSGNGNVPAVKPAGSNGKPNRNENVIDVLASMKGVSRGVSRLRGTRRRKCDVPIPDVRWQGKSMLYVLDEPAANRGPE